MRCYEVSAVGRADVKPLRISERLKSQLVYFMSPRDAPGTPPLAESEFWIPLPHTREWLDQGAILLVSPLDSENQTEVELSEEQEDLLVWLDQHGVEHIRVSEQIA
ncbi:MAG: hypothetical protein HY000_00770 [Planctomycetes bacterium]|nr:hypothetical protein [Planctomycetota bacterium]